MLDRGFDGRTSAIAYGSRLVFDGLGLWPDIAADAEPIREIRIADDESPLFLHYDCRELIPRHGDAMPLGYIVENRVLRRVLLDRARALPSLTADRRTPRRRDARDRYRRRRSRSTTARACARGSSPPPTATNSPLRHTAGIRAVEWRYRQIGIVTTVRARAPACRHRGRAFSARRPVRDPADDRRAGPTGHAPRGRSSIVWTEHADLAPRLLALARSRASPPNCAPASAGFSARSSRSGRAGAYPLALMQAERYIARRLALVGEAAHVIHPIAGQGLNIGIRDVAALAELIVDRRRLGLDIGDDGAAGALSALAPRRRAAARRRHRRPQPPVLEHDSAAAPGPRYRSRDRPPDAAAEARSDAARDGPARRPAPSRQGDEAVGRISAA